MLEVCIAWFSRGLTLYLIETPFIVLANRADPDQAALGLLCLLMEIRLGMILY